MSDNDNVGPIEAGNTDTQELQPQIDAPSADEAAKPEGEAVTPEQPDSSKKDKPEKTSGSGRKHFQNQRLREENAQLQAQLAELRGGKQGAGQAETGEPQEKDFENVLDFVKAYSKWSSDNSVNGYEQKKQQAQLTEHREELVEDHDARSAEFSKEFPDFAEKQAQVIQSGLVNENMMDAVLESDISEKIAYHLAQYPNDLIQMAQMRTPQQLRAAVKQIETFIGANPLKAAVKNTQASAPINPPKAKTGTSKEMPSDFKDFVKWAKPLK